jgi:adhesin transport system membrane fusion protein
VFNNIKTVFKRLAALLKAGISYLMIFQKEIRTEEGKDRLRKKLNKITYYSKFVLRETFSYDTENRERMSSQFLFIITGIFVVGIFWAVLAELDQVVSAQGKVLSSGRLQVIEHFEGGRVQKIHVKTGEEVNVGDLLISLVPLQAQGEFNIVKENNSALAVRLARLNAELNQTNKLDLPDEIVNEYPDIVRTELALLKEKQSYFQSQQLQKKNDISSAKARFNSANSGFSAAKEEARVVKQLVERGLEARLSLVRSEKSLAEANSAMLVAREEVLKAEQALSSFIKEYQTNILNEITKSRSEFSSSRENVRISADKNDRTALRSPVSGTVNRILVTTEGQTVKAGEPVAEIVPSGSSVIIEAKVKPADIGFVRLKQRALVKLTTYDYSIFGALDGFVSVIGSDSITEEKGEQFYVVKIELASSYVDSGKENMTILPGMIAQIDIVTGKRTVFNYIFSPLTKVMQESLREK